MQELTDLAIASGQPAYRGQQLFDAVYRQKIERLDRVSTLPLEYRARLAEQGWGMGFPEIARKFVSSDGTVRYLVELADGETVETVWMPEGDGGESGDGSEAGDEEAGNEIDDAERVVAGGGRPPRTGLSPVTTHQLASGDDLRLEPGGMRGQLQVLFHGAAGDQAESGGGRNRWADRGSAPGARSRAAAAARQHSIHGHGRTLFEL